MSPQRFHVGARAFRRDEQSGHLVGLAYCVAVKRRHATRAQAAPRGGGEEGERQDRQGLAALCAAG